MHNIKNVVLWSSVVVTCESNPALSHTLIGRYSVAFGTVDPYAPHANGQPVYDRLVRVTAMAPGQCDMDATYISGNVLSATHDTLIMTAKAWSTPVLYDAESPAGRIAVEQTVYSDVRIVCSGPVTREV